MILAKPDFSIVEEKQEVILQKRNGLTAKQKTEILSANTICPLCKLEIASVKEAQFDHVIPIALGGDAKPSNMVAMHRNCHRIKTDDDVKKIAKVKRIRKKASGETRPKRKIRSRGFRKKEK